MNINYINKFIFSVLSLTSLLKLSISLKYNNIILEKNNFVEIVDIINEKNTYAIIKDLAILSDKTSNLFIYINSPGGSVTDGEKIINQINFYQNLNYTVNCIALNAYSMAFYIFQSCNKRYITNITKLMTHQMVLSIPKMSFENLVNYLKIIKQIDDNLTNMVCKRINMSYEDYIKKRQSDWWIYSDDIIKYKLADEIVFINHDVAITNLTTDIYSIKYF